MTSARQYNSRISIHALREEGDEVLPADTFKINLFLSTPSARRATLAVSIPCGIL